MDDQHQHRKYHVLIDLVCKITMNFSNKSNIWRSEFHELKEKFIYMIFLLIEEKKDKLE